MITKTHPNLNSLTVQHLRQVFASVDAASCPHSLNFHLHTVYSDGKMQPEESIDQAIALGMSHLAITDHHTTRGYFVAIEHLEHRARQASERDVPKLPQLWAGVEINASLLFTEVHILGYAFDPHHKAISPYVQGRNTAGLEYQAVSVINAIHSAGGIAVLAHPMRYRRSPQELIPAAAALQIDGVETYYGYDNSDPWQPSPKQTKLVRQLAETHGLLCTCGTDSHGSKITRRL
ncbi:PHP domain-containing protein [Pseudanabaena sp. PCC 6802]|uniref:PHP domain-containing protein n=1 Tax=Pseudanabaena sp. PCC 6802 TaxID=118173 RepID=UPI00037EE3C8|nr:PHP domain-containing protein [Pseudanabaena sp. PCC 6802]